MLRLSANALPIPANKPNSKQMTKSFATLNR